MYKKFWLYPTYMMADDTHALEDEYIKNKWDQCVPLVKLIHKARMSELHFQSEDLYLIFKA